MNFTQRIGLGIMLSTIWLSSMNAPFETFTYSVMFTIGIGIFIGAEY